MTGRELVVFGQDEAIFCTSQLNNNTWYVNDQANLRSKGMGVGIMVSSFCLRKFGFGMKITENDLEKVNTYWRGKYYVKEEATTFLNGSASKGDLKESPVLRLLEHG